jgi:hypothetical protein
MSYFQQLFGRASMDRIGAPAINRFNRESTLAIASVTPGTQWNGPDSNGRPQAGSLVPGTYNLDITFKTPLPIEQNERYLDAVVRAADGKYGANGNNLGLRIQSLTSGQITKALDAARRWEQAHSAGSRATDELRGVPLQDRNAVLTSYRSLQTDVQRTYFRSMMGKVSLDAQVPLARVLARLTAHMTQDLAAGGPLHEPDITSFQLQVRGMPRAEKNALHQLPIGDVAVRLFFPNEPVRRGLHLATLSIS